MKENYSFEHLTLNNNWPCTKELTLYGTFRNHWLVRAEMQEGTELPVA